ncbi:MAG: cupin domain-containing protein [Candidatus Brocadiae bacterium]|nr:cupin domain-containing protein [Candidatus Brocadiia bacterium]
MSPHPAGPTRVVPFEKAAVVRAFGEEVHFLLRAAETNGAYTLFLELTPPGGGPPPHFHKREDEWFHVLEGRAEYLVEGKRREVPAGSSVYVPRNAVHTFRNAGTTPLRQLIATRPCGFEEFFRKSGEVFRGGGAPDMARIVAIGEEHGIVFQLPGAPPLVPATVPASTPAIVQPADTRVQRLFGEEITVLLSARQTGGTLTTFLETTPPGGGPPPHRLPKFDEWFTVLEGRVSFFGDAHWTEVGPGGAFFAPRGAVHTYRNDGPSPARMLVQTSPSGIESFFDAAAAEFARPGGPDMEKAMGIAAAHGIEFV